MNQVAHATVEKKSCKKLKNLPSLVKQTTIRKLLERQNKTKATKTKLKNLNRVLREQ